MGMESSFGTWETVTTPSKKKEFPSSIVTKCRGSSGRHNARKSSPLSMWKFTMARSYEELVQTAPDAANVWVHSPCRVQKDHFVASSSPYNLSISPFTPQGLPQRCLGTIRMLTGFMFWGTSNEKLEFKGCFLDSRTICELPCILGSILYLPWYTSHSLCQWGSQNLNVGFLTILIKLWPLILC